ncbi:aminotransferase class V-fold PLP-dependent enzyme [Rhodobacteraceae bacterium N5(2021)]|uniref:Aminotransferase class V-fold PLP-dependent enzyme n=1 Tax=Gymnodinialimonas phycosphaerae TaxID=2841589 RepID=A0A975TW12_9RHOB|nr:aminotransferase class V-fold PLP-dependent enzyme [Gymnodinialimonas phycosphaerae]MBY4891945.1 aminotransferase class V-fold PLP-dependent enzyme [Gymnodinialimonas phycosphaerae]
MTALADFRDGLDRPDIVEFLRDGLIGDGVAIETPFGSQRLVYADYVASGRALRQVEDFVMEHVLPYYANSHTEASFCGMTMTRMREEARATIARLVKADESCHVIFAGSGATAGINRIVGLLQIEKLVASDKRVVVLIGPYEHHSNILPWRETGAELVVVPEAPGGGLDMAALRASLTAAQGADLIVGSFSAASNVTGIVTDTTDVTRVLKANGALAIWDYAGGAPYLPMEMGSSADCQKDAIIFSPHKFAGGPGATGIAVVRDTIVRCKTPTAPGGGTVSFVSPWRHAYSAKVEVREEAGTPNVVGDIRAALVMLVKDAIGTDAILARDAVLRDRASTVLARHPFIRVLGKSDNVPALPIFSFQVADEDGTLVHQQLFTRMLSDFFGVQVRGGCACAGPYAHALLGLDEAQSEDLFKRLGAGHEVEKPGWVRFNLSYLHSDAQVASILEAISTLASTARERAAQYECDPATARFNARGADDHTLLRAG